MPAWRCRSCDADWSAGAWSAGCAECGGGAMERNCVLCGDRCGARWTRAPMDSNDFGEAHWHGGCRLPREEQQRILQHAASGGPERIGPYEIRGELGRGGMGVVYRAYHPELEREMALKVIRSDVAGPEDEDLAARFRREAQAAARLADHPGIVAVRDLGESDGRLYLAMDLVPGRGFDERIHDGDVGERLAVGVIEQAARAVHHAHEAGFLHRDLKPANILVTDAGDAFVTDFGLAGLTRLEADAQRLTASNLLIGTPEYMSPEQAATGQIDGTADVWALGVTLYEALCHRTPFAGETTLAVLTALLHDEVPPVRRFAPEVSPEAEAVVMRCLERDPAGRYPTALALAEDCARLARGETPHAKTSGSFGPFARSTAQRRALRVAAGVAVLAVVLGAVWWGVTRTEQRVEQQVAERSEETQAADDRAARAEAFRVIEEQTRAHFAVLEDEPRRTGQPRGAAAAARDAVRAVLDGRPAEEQEETALRAWRAYLQVLSGELEAGVLRDLADGDPDDPVVRVLFARAVLLRYAATLEMPHAAFASAHGAGGPPVVQDTEAAGALRAQGVEALLEASKTALWPQLPHGAEALAILGALQAIPHADWTTVHAELAAARDDPWWGVIAEILRGYACAMEQRYADGADILEALATARRRPDLFLTAGLMRLDAARAAENARRPSEAVYRAAADTLGRASELAPWSTEAAAAHAAARIEHAALAARVGRDVRPQLRAVVEQLDLRAASVDDSPALELPRARAWLIAAQVASQHGADPSESARACIAACKRHLQTHAEAVLAYQYLANAWTIVAARLMQAGSDGGPALTESLRALDAVLRLKPGDGVALNDRGTTRLQLAMQSAVRGRNPLELLADAAADFEAAAKTSPAWVGPVANLTDVHLLHAQWLAATGQDAVARFEQAIGQVSRAIAAEPETAMYHSRRGVIRRHLATHLRQRGRPVGDLLVLARADFGKALELQPDFVEALQGRAELLLSHVAQELEAGALPTAAADEAIQRLRHAAKLQPGAPAVLNPLARAYFQRGRVAVAAGEDPAAFDAAALKLFDALVQGVPGQATHILNRSYARLMWGLRAQAGGKPGTEHLTACLADVERALTLNPRMPNAHHRKGLCLHALGRHGEAIAAFEAALALDPSHPGTAAALRDAKAALARAQGR